MSAGAKPPAYDTVEYWNNKYFSAKEPFDWLVPPYLLVDEIGLALTQIDATDAQVLHVGSGNSELAFILRDLVPMAENIYNVDFSPMAVEWGKQEEELRLSNQNNKHANDDKRKDVLGSDGRSRMKWIHASVTSLDSLLKSCNPFQFSMVIDKSTSDSVNIGDDVLVSFPFPQIVGYGDAPSTQPMRQSIGQTIEVQAIQVMALNLACLTQPGAIWIALSYNQHRFDFLYKDEEEDENVLSQHALNSGYPNTKLLWELVKVTGLETAEEYVQGGSMVHRAKVLHYMFVIKRTGATLNLPTIKEKSKENHSTDLNPSP